MLTTDQIISDELLSIKAQGIDFDVRRVGSKSFAVITLDSGKKLLVCPRVRRVTYCNKTYKYNKISSWMRKNNLICK